MSAGPSVAELLASSRFEILPLEGVEEQVREHLPKDVKVTVTASPRKGLEATLELSERLARAGYPVVPHLSARLVRDRAHLEEVLARLLTRQFKPSKLLEQLTPIVTNPERGVAGFHLYTFNEVGRTERWRQRTLSRLAGR